MGRSTVTSCRHGLLKILLPFNNNEGTLGVLLDGPENIAWQFYVFRCSVNLISSRRPIAP